MGLLEEDGQWDSVRSASDGVQDCIREKECNVNPDVFWKYKILGHISEKMGKMRRENTKLNFSHHLSLPKESNSLYNCYRFFEL